MTSLAELKLTYHPVGQGLFASGKLELVGCPAFHWVYDCGTSSRKTLLANAIDQYEKSLPDKKIDLLVLSHFDKDHISGLVDLLTRFDVGILMLPFVPLWLRLAIAMGSGVKPSSSIFSYFLNPVKAFSALGSVGTILLVPSEDDEAGDREVRERRREPREPSGLDVSWRRCKPTQEMRPEVDSAGATVGVDVLPVKAPVLVQGIWEYLPYNDRTVAPPPGSFVDAVKDLRDRLLASPSKAELDKLKNAYDKQFGAGAKPRNVISLFLYAGPLAKLSRSNWAYTWVGTGVVTREMDEARLGAFYTGDGYLNTSKRLDQFIDFYGPYRVSQCLCFQVMHHGAKNNWRVGTGARVAPTYSIFNAGRSGKKPRHPSGEVVKDFLPFGPRLVDESTGFRIRVA